MEHHHPLPDSTELCPYCGASPRKCCLALEAIKEKARVKSRAKYHRNIEKSRAKSLRHYHKRKTKPTPPGQ